MTRAFFLSLCFFLCFQQGHSSHFTHGMIWYEHVGGPNQHDYVFKTLLAVNSLGIAITHPTYIFQIYESTNPTGTTYSLNAVLPPPQAALQGRPNTWRIDQPWNCGQSSPFLNDFGYVLFTSDTLTLSANKEYDIFLSGICCRDLRDNLDNNSGNLLLRAKLNTSFGPFSLIPPGFELFENRVPKNVLTTLGSIATSNDSVALSWSPVFKGQPSSPTTVGYKAGYSASAMIGAGATTTVLQGQNSLMQINAPNIGIYSLGLKYSVYKYSNQSQTWIEAGWYVADFPLIVTDQVDSVNLQALQFDSITQPRSTLCKSKELILYSPAGFNRNSLDTNGLQFRVLAPVGNLNPIVSAEIIDPTRLRLNLFKPIDSNGTYQVIPRLGSNGAYLQGQCGYELPRDTIRIVVSGCNAFSLSEDFISSMIYPNPSEGKIRLSKVPVDIKLTIYDLYGRPQFRSSFRDQFDLNLAPGTYILVIESDQLDLPYQEKLIISN
jgi:hypothetical protein